MQISLNELQIKREKAIKYLGVVTWYCHLNWKSHIPKLQRKSDEIYELFSSQAMFQCGVTIEGRVVNYLKALKALGTVCKLYQLMY